MTCLPRALGLSTVTLLAPPAGHRYKRADSRCTPARARGRANRWRHQVLLQTEQNLGLHGLLLPRRAPVPSVSLCVESEELGVPETRPQRPELLCGEEGSGGFGEAAEGSGALLPSGEPPSVSEFRASPRVASPSS